MSLTPYASDRLEPTQASKVKQSWYAGKLYKVPSTVYHFSHVSFLRCRSQRHWKSVPGLSARSNACGFGCYHVALRQWHCAKHVEYRQGILAEESEKTQKKDAKVCYSFAVWIHTCIERKKRSDKFNFCFDYLFTAKYAMSCPPRDKKSWKQHSQRLVRSLSACRVAACDVWPENWWMNPCVGIFTQRTTTTHYGS